MHVLRPIIVPQGAFCTLMPDKSTKLVRPKDTDAPQTCSASRTDPVARCLLTTFYDFCF